MGKSIGLLELKSIPVGVETADAVLKAANVELLTASPHLPREICHHSLRRGRRGKERHGKREADGGDPSCRQPHYQQCA